MSQDYQEAIREHFYDLASDAPVHYGLSDVLADQPPHRLAAIKKAIGYTLSDHDLTRMSDMLTDPLFLEELLLFLPEDSIQALDCFRRHNLTYEDIIKLPGVHELIVFGLVYIYRTDLTFAMPDEIRQALPLHIDSDHQNRWQQAIRLMRGAINLYGAIEVDELMRQIKRLPEAKQMPLQVILSLILRSTRIIWQHGPWLTSTAWCRDEKELLALLSLQKSFPYRALPISELMLYADDCYVERTEALDNLEQYLLSSSVSAEQVADSVLLVGIGLRRDETNKVFDQLLKSLKIETIDQVQLMRLIHAVAADVRQIRYRGHSSREKADLIRQKKADFSF